MRKVYSTMLLALIAMLGFTVSANAESLSFKVKADPAEYTPELMFYVEDEEYELVTEGEYDEAEGVWNITIEDYNPEMMYTVSMMYVGEGTAITGITDQTGEDAFENYYIWWQEQPFLISGVIFDDSWDGAEFTLHIGELVADTHVTINIDNASKAILRDYTWTTIDLVDGTNEFDFISGMQLPLDLSNNVGDIDPWDDSDEPAEDLGIYKVTINGNPVRKTYGSWTLDVADGDVVDIVTVWPDADFSVKINVPEGCEGIIEYITAGEDKVELPSSYDEPLVFHVGTNLGFMFNINDYELNGVMVNGASQWVYRTLEVQVVDDMVIDIDCAKYSNFNVTVTNNNPDIVNVYTGSSIYYKENIIDFSEGNTKSVELSSGDAALCWEVNEANAGKYVITATLNGEEVNTSSVSVEEGDVVVVSAQEIIRDETLIVFLPDFDAFNAAAIEDGYLGSSTGLSIQNADYNKLEGLHNGYNEVPFLQTADSPLRYIQQYPSKPDAEDLYDYIFKVYLNDEEVEVAWGSMCQNVNVKDGDVLKVYQLGTVEEYKLDITADETIEDNEINVTKDIVIPVFNWKEGVQSYRDTEVNIEIVPEDGYEYGVKVDGEDLQPTEGVYKIVLDANKKAEISKTSGVLNILGENGKSDIFNSQGVRILTNATKADLNNLPKGVYIINGKKVIK